MPEVREEVVRCPLCEGVIAGSMDKTDFICADAFRQFMNSGSQSIDFGTRLAAMLSIMPVGPTHAELGYGEEDDELRDDVR